MCISCFLVAVIKPMARATPGMESFRAHGLKTTMVHHGGRAWQQEQEAAGFTMYTVNKQRDKKWGQAGKPQGLPQSPLVPVK